MKTRLCMSAYQRITFRNEQDNNSDDASYQLKCISIKIQGLSKGQKRTKENFKDFQAGLENGRLKFKGFQDAYEP